MNINRLLIATNELGTLDTGAVLTFRENLMLLDGGDALVVRLSDGSERLLLIRQISGSGWIADEQSGSECRSRQLERVDDHKLRVVAVN